MWLFQGDHIMSFFIIKYEYMRVCVRVHESTHAHICACVLNISIMSSQVLFWLWLLKLVCLRFIWQNAFREERI